MKRRIISLVLIVVAVTVFAVVLILKLNEDNTFVGLNETEQEMVFEGASRNLVKKYVELRMLTEEAIRGEMDYDEADEVAIAWGELYNATETFAKMNVTDSNVGVNVGNLGERGARKITKGIQGAYGWNYPVAKEVAKLNEMIMADAKMIGEQVKLAEKDLGKFEEEMKKIQSMTRVELYFSGDGYDSEKENLASEGILILNGVDMLVQVGKSNAGIVIKRGEDEDLKMSAEEFRGLPAISEESAVLGVMLEGENGGMMYLADGLASLVQVSRVVKGEMEVLENGYKLSMDSIKLAGVSSAKMEEQGMKVVGEKLKNIKDAKEDLIVSASKKYKVTWIEEKIEEAYARVAGS